MTDTMTITEALAEIKTIGKRIAKKREFVRSVLLRQDMLKDPLEKQGGSVQAIKSERQSISDLEGRIVKLRRAIMDANNTNTVTILGETKSITDWLTWRREVAPGQKDFLAGLQNAINRARSDATQRGLAVVSSGEATRSEDVVVNLDEQELATDAERLEEILGTLDGQLSLKNATVTVTV